MLCFLYDTLKLTFELKKLCLILIIMTSQEILLTKHLDYGQKIKKILYCVIKLNVAVNVFSSLQKKKS